MENKFKETEAEKFWNSYDKSLLARYAEAKEEEKEVYGLRVSKVLLDDFREKTDNDKLKMANIVNMAIIEYIYKTK